ncbi:hypothetical protein FNV43_RR14756 [Rhamnella rubrinervis]|uniref:Uncharacterized protein n=1 Tax=Rhamnella rubrinervis TaxID=2594499 RepID=A0A8K0H3X4_9ROSA|nr:hypothetical protein FNV43_RR14756 [Rhamnella rubrinervis]
MRSSITKVVEYLEPLMSKELLCKFPDNSAFDFDYSQSSIWSPLVPRAYSPMDLEADLDFITPRKLTYEMGFDQLGIQSSLKKVNSKAKKKITAVTAFKINLSALKSKKKKKSHIKKKKKMNSDSSPTPSITCNPAATRKVWNKVLKVASKHFKRKKKDTTSHVRLSNFLSEGNV